MPNCTDYEDHERGFWHKHVGQTWPTLRWTAKDGCSGDCCIECIPQSFTSLVEIDRDGLPVDGKPRTFADAIGKLLRQSS